MIMGIERLIYKDRLNNSSQKTERTQTKIHTIKADVYREYQFFNLILEIIGIP